MNLLLAIIVIAVVVVVVGAVALALFEMSPFARHSDSYRDPITHQRRWEAPNLEDGHY